MKKTGKPIPSIQIIQLILAVAGFYILTFILKSLGVSHRVLLSASQCGLIAVDGAFLVTCFYISRGQRQAWKILFICLAFAKLFSILLLTAVIFQFINSHPFMTIIIHVLALAFKFTAWSIVAFQLIEYSRTKRHQFFPFFPSIVTIIFSIFFIIIDVSTIIIFDDEKFYHQQWQTFFEKNSRLFKQTDFIYCYHENTFIKSLE